MPLDRRRFLLATAGAALAPLAGRAQPEPHQRTLARDGTPIPAVGMGTWITFDVGADEAARALRVEVLRRFLAAGGRVVDSSPMYGSSPDVIGHCLAALGAERQVLGASKVWIPGRGRGIEQMAHARERWGVDRFWAMQVHNLVDWKSHLPTLRSMRERGEVAVVGVTTSHGRRHAELLRIIRSEPLDTVQLTYNVAERAAEERLLPAAAEAGIGVIVNRPFATGGLFRAVAGRPLPPWAGDLGIATWSQFFLNFVISHPAVTCAIPATSQPAHMSENMAALTGPLPGRTDRRRMIRWFEDVAG